MTTNPLLFQPHLHPLLRFLLTLILPTANPGLTPMVGDNTNEDGMTMASEIEDIWKVVLEFVISLKPGGVRKVNR